MAAERVTSGLERWDEEYRDDPVWATIDDLITELQQAQPDSEDYRYQRLLLTLQFIYGYRDIPNILVSSSMMTALRTVVQGHLSTQIRNWITNSNPAHLDNSITQLNAALEQMRGWPVNKERSLYSAARTVQAATGRLERRFTELEEAIAQNKAELEECGQDQEKRFDDREDRHINRFNELDAKLDTVSQELTDIDTRLDTIINQQQERFDQSQQERTKDWEKLLADHRTDYSKQLRNFETLFNEVISNNKKRASEHMEDMQQLQSQAGEMVSILATSATSKWYQDHADQQKESADKMRSLAIGLGVVAFLVTGVWVVLAAFQVGAVDNSWSMNLVKTTVSITLVAAASYAAAESGKHRDEEFKARQTELKLKALEPFIQAMEETKREQIMTSAAHQFFGLNGEGIPISTKSKVEKVDEV